ncbi:branched-chain amino acid ABC transporter permease [Ancylobacter sp. WKF20]|uniref:branched-chain amino acid ABC transporter permease n=1 Tax=Ancylobacter sp. WKF20 TaxID=3039801 RepID=UPI0024346061|nr:branched-chain amino acid ABC transporter permease [Ancylobacter sp. WKF20]WGD31158.1 branched-chain amino acid ABC transporter permease [Ancylobacter sp. WKF20]
MGAGAQVGSTGSDGTPTRPPRRSGWQAARIGRFFTLTGLIVHLTALTRQPFKRLSPLLAALFLLAGCGSVIDADQARICRAVAPALHGEDVEVLETSLNSVPGAPTALRYSYRVRSDSRTTPHWLICTFAAQTGVGRFDLTAVDTDQGTLSDIKLLILKRWWLSDAPPEGTMAALFHLGPRSAYWVQQALGGLVMTGVYGLIATGFSLVYGLLGRVNLAFGEIAVVAGTYMLIAVGVASDVGRLGPAELTLALLAGIASAALVSWLAGHMVVAPLAARVRSPQPVLIATAGLAITLAELLRLTAPDRVNWLPALMNRPIAVAGQDAFIATVTPAQLLAAGLSMCGTSLLLGIVAFTRFGLFWRAHAQDPRMAALLGVDVQRLRTQVFLLAGAAAGLAGGVIVIAFGTISPGDGLSITLKALISAVIGGIGSVPGAFLGAALVAAVEIGWSSTFDIAYRDVVTYALLVVFLVMRPGGLLNRAAPTPREF